MPEAEKTVFISYRRSTSRHLARAIFMDLRSHGYDVFMDVDTLDSGEFERIILNQVAARMHFVLLLTPGALDRCNEPDDWLRREIERAIELNRNIVPVIEEGFNFTDAAPYLTGTLSSLPRYNAVLLYHAYFDAALDNLRTRFLKSPVYNVALTPTPAAEQAVVQQQIKEVVEEPPQTLKQVKVRGMFNKAVQLHAEKDFKGAITIYSDILKQYPDNGMAYRNRGIVKIEQDDFPGALLDLNHAVRLSPNDWQAYHQRGWVRYNRGNIDGALADYDEAIRINPQTAKVYFRRGLARQVKGQFDLAAADFTDAIRLEPRNPEHYNLRAGIRYQRGENEAAIADWSEAIKLDRKNAILYSNRGEAYFADGQLLMALADFQQANQLKPNYDIIVGGLAVTSHALGHINEARKHWRELLKRDKQYEDADWAGKQFNWVPSLVEEAHKLVLML